MVTTRIKAGKNRKRKEKREKRNENSILLEEGEDC